MRRRLLSAGFTLLLWLSYVAVAYAWGAAVDADIETAFTAAQLYFAVVCVALVPFAYRGAELRWWHWLLWPGLGLTFGLIAMIWLPWRIVRRDAG